MAAPGADLQEVNRFHCNDGPIGFALDAISQWHKQLTFVVRFLHAMKAARPTLPSNIRMHMERQTTSRYLLHILITEAVAAELFRLQHTPLRRARHRLNHRAPSTSEPLIHQPQHAARNTPRPEIAIASPERRVEMWAAKVVG